MILAPGISLFSCPTDDTLTEFLSLLQGSSVSIHLADYSFNIMAVVELLEAKVKAGVDVKLVLDKSQSTGSTEAPEIKALQASSVPFVIVESSLHQIMHSKTTVIDGHITETGSWNYTTAASKENNTFFVFDDDLMTEKARIATQYEQIFSDMWNGKTTIIESE